MSPTILRIKGYRFFFFSREEERPHIHIETAEGEAKFWIEPEVELAMSNGIPYRKVKEIRAIAKSRKNEFKKAWNKHFGNHRKNR